MLRVVIVVLYCVFMLNFKLLEKQLKTSLIVIERGKIRSILHKMFPWLGRGKFVVAESNSPKTIRYSSPYPTPS